MNNAAYLRKRFVSYPDDLQLVEGKRCSMVVILHSRGGGDLATSVKLLILRIILYEWCFSSLSRMQMIFRRFSCI